MCESCVCVCVPGGCVCCKDPILPLPPSHPPSLPLPHHSTGMPELPEVAALAAALESEAKGKRLLRVLTKEAGGGPRDGLYDELVFSGADEKEVQRAMEGRVLTGVGRKGKHLWMELSLPPASSSSSSSSSSSAAASRGGKEEGGGGDSTSTKRFVLFHMGMTGSLLFQHVAIPQYRSFALDASKGWPPKFCKAQFIFSSSSSSSSSSSATTDHNKKKGGGKEEEEDEVHLAFCDQRRWGRVQVLPAGVEDPRTEAPLKELAPDAWKERPTLEVFGAKLKETEIPIKAALLDQGRVVCGLGNWVCDEVLFQAGVDPAKKCRGLTEGEVRRVWEMIGYVCETACAANARSEEFPEGWLFNYRWAKTKKDKAGVKGPGGRGIVFETIGGRTTAIVPSVQRAKKGGGEGGEAAGGGGGGEGGGGKEGAAVGGKGKGKKKQVKEEVGGEQDQAKASKKEAGKGTKRVKEEVAGEGMVVRAGKKAKTEAADVTKKMPASTKTTAARRSSPRAQAAGTGTSGGAKPKGKAQKPK